MEYDNCKISYPNLFTTSNVIEDLEQVCAVCKANKIALIVDDTAVINNREDQEGVNKEDTIFGIDELHIFPGVTCDGNIIDPNCEYNYDSSVTVGCLKCKHGYHGVVDANGMIS